MLMTKKDLEIMIKESVKESFNDMKPIIKKTIREEFYKLLSEAKSNNSKKRVVKTNKSESTKQSGGLSMKSLMDDLNKPNSKNKLFKDNPFSNILNDTVNEIINRVSPELGGIDKQIDKKSIAEKLGYGDLKMESVNDPVTTLPATDAGGNQINYNDVPSEVIENLTKNYSDILKKTNEIANKNRG